MIEATQKYEGTPGPIALECGALHLTAEDNKLRSISWQGIEVVREISAPVRDGNWGTMPEVTIETLLDKQGARLSWTRKFELADGTAHGQLKVCLHEAGVLDVVWELTPDRSIRVNRAGLCVLHPLSGAAGEALWVTTPDGQTIEKMFPRLISPSQVATNIQRLRHTCLGVSVDLNFQGEVFEMEDQRNWSDASFKTYCRSLALPWNFCLPKGAKTRQQITIKLSSDDSLEEVEPRSSKQDRIVVMPEILLACEPSWIDGPVPNGCARLSRFADTEWTDTQLAKLCAVPFDAEFVVPEGVVPKEFLINWAERFEKVHVSPRSVIVLPKAYLKSYQPAGDWPTGYSPEDCVEIARSVFPEAHIGVGVLTNFTELNRCRPALGVGDYVTHGNSAIVHAADDLSVWQTLEALPSIFESAREIALDRRYRLGLVAIGMRSNPYGVGLSPNPTGKRRTMTDEDPRQKLDFAATYAIAATALAAVGNAEAISLASSSGPFGLISIDGRERPIARVTSLLSTMAGKRAEVSAEGGHFRIATDDLSLYANCTLEPWNVADTGMVIVPGGWTHLVSGAEQ